MKERLKNNRLFINKANIAKKEVKLGTKLIDYKDLVEKQKSKQNKNSKKLLTKKLEPIKVRLTPFNKRHNPNEKKNDIQKSNTLTENNKDFAKNLYLSPIHDSNSEKERNINNKCIKKNYTESRNDLKEIKLNRNCTTPYRRILNNKYGEELSPSTSVIIKNFNYNNVYNFNIDNDKSKDNKIGMNNNSINNNNKTTYNESYSNTCTSAFTYNKPKTSTGITSSCISTKNKNSLNFFSNFITDSNNLDNKRKSLLCDDIVFNVPKLELNQNKNKNNFSQTQLIDNNTFKLNNKKININDYNNASKKLNKNRKLNINNSYNNNISQTKYDSFSNINLKNNSINSFYKTSTISLKNNFKKIKNNINSLKYYNKNQQKTEPNLEDFNLFQKDKFEKEIGFNLNDLFIFEDRYNDIVSAFNNRNNIYDIEASNECNEFMSFYAKSSLKGIFPTFFAKNNQLIIDSSINLYLFFISIIHHLSINNILFNEIISTINNILSLLKINFSLYIMQIQLFYGKEIIKKNYSYFQPFITFLNNKGIKDIEQEDDITYRIYQNCRIITNEIKNIMKYYQKINTNYYDYFIRIFNNISIQKENDLISNFFNGYKDDNSTFNLITVNIKKNSIDPKELKNTQNKKNIKENIYIKTPKKMFNKFSGCNKKDIKNIIEIPYLKEPSNKKYTLVLNLNKTLAFYNKGNITLRNGLFSFLSMIKPYYELISFSSEPDKITTNIIKEIESKEKIFDFNFGREHCILCDNILVKDISLVGRDLKDIIIVDDNEKSFQLNEENGIKISKFEGNNEFDNALFELKKILILIYKANYDDVRIALKEFASEINNKITKK